MMHIKLPDSLLYWLTIVIAMGLNIISWPMPVLVMMPDWVLLVLLYWSLAAPELINVGKAWFVGLLLDVLTGQLLGQYALAYAFCVFLSAKQHKRIRQFPLLQQSMFISGIFWLELLLIFWIEKIDQHNFTLQFWWPMLTGGLLWPLVSAALRKLRGL